MTLTLIHGGRPDYSKMTAGQLMEILVENYARDPATLDGTPAEQRAERRVMVARYELRYARKRQKQLLKRLEKRRKNAKPLKAVK